MQREKNRVSIPNATSISSQDDSLTHNLSDQCVLQQAPAEQHPIRARITILRGLFGGPSLDGNSKFDVRVMGEGSLQASMKCPGRYMSVAMFSVESSFIQILDHQHIPSRSTFHIPGRKSPKGRSHSSL